MFVETAGYNPGYNFHRKSAVGASIGSALRKEMKSNPDLVLARQDGKLRYGHTTKKFEDHTHEEHSQLSSFHSRMSANAESSKERDAHRRLADAHDEAVLAHREAAKSVRGVEGLTAAGVKVMALKGSDEVQKRIFGHELSVKDIEELNGSGLIASKHSGALVNHSVFIGKMNTKVTTQVLDKEGYPIAEVERTYKRTHESSTMEVEHDFFKVSDQLKGQGLGSEVIAHQLSQYRKLGGAQVNVSTGLDDGRYMWARTGFTPSDAHMDRVVGVASSSFHYYLKMDKAEAATLAESYRSKPWELAGLRNPTSKSSPRTLGQTIFRDSGDWSGKMIVPGEGQPSNPGFDHAVKYLNRNKSK